MKDIEIIKEQVLNQGLNTLLKRLETLFSEYQLRLLTEPTVVSVEIVNMEKVIDTIKSVYTCFNIKDVKPDLKSQTMSFKIYGSCYIPEKYRGYRILNDAWSATQTDEYSYLKTVKEEYAEEFSMPLSDFKEGLRIEII